MLNLNITLFQNDLFYCFAEIYLIFFIIGLVYFSLMFTNLKKTLSSINLINFNLKISLYFFLLYIFLIVEEFFFFNSDNNLIFIFNELLTVSQFILYLKLFLAVLIIIFIFFILFFYKFEKNVSFEFLIIILLAFLGMNFLLMANDFISFYLALELQSLAIYILATFFRNSTFSTEAGLKYFIIGSLGSILLLFSFSIIYGMTGMTKFSNLFIFVNLLNLESVLETNLYLILGIWFGLFFFLISIFLKLGVVPFHIWVPDVYEGVFLIVLSFLAIFPKIVMLSIFVKFILVFQSIWILPFHFFLIICSTLSILLGNIGGLYQIKLKRLFAYSTISNMGFILLGISLFNYIGIFSSFFYLIFYIILLITFFSLLFCLKRNKTFLEIKKISELSNLFLINPTLSLIFALTLFSFAGIPPLSGFFIKMFLFFSLLSKNLIFLSIFIIILSAISAFYYIRLIKLMFFSSNKLNTSWIFLVPISKALSYIISLSFLVNICFFIYPDFFLFVINDFIFAYYL